MVTNLLVEILKMPAALHAWVSFASLVDILGEGYTPSGRMSRRGSEARLKSAGGTMLYSSFLGLIALSLYFGITLAASGHEKDDRTIRSMVDQAISRLNKGDVTAFD